MGISHLIYIYIPNSHVLMGNLPTPQGICDKDHTLQQTIAGPEEFAMKKDPCRSMIYLFP